MKRIASSFLSAALLVTLAAACGHARMVNRTQYGGTFALEGDRYKALEDAHSQMNSHCQGPYTIVSEGEQVIGQDSAQQNETYVAEDGTLVNEGGASTRDATEWRVQYQCGQSQTVPSQASPYPGQPGTNSPQQGPYPGSAPGAPPPPPPGNY
jgi:hypothetical protein